MNLIWYCVLHSRVQHWLHWWMEFSCHAYRLWCVGLCSNRLHPVIAVLSFEERLHFKGTSALYLMVCGRFWLMSARPPRKRQRCVMVSPRDTAVVIPRSKYLLVEIQRRVIVTGRPAPSHLDNSYISVCLLTKCHSWARSPTALALPGKRVAYCSQ